MRAWSQQGAVSGSCYCLWWRLLAQLLLLLRLLLMGAAFAPVGA